MLTQKQLLEVLEITKGYQDVEVKELRRTAVKLLSGCRGINKTIEEQSLLVQMHNVLGL